MIITQELLNSMMREIGDRPKKPKNNLPVCPKCGERYLGDGVDLCTECEAVGNLPLKRKIKFNS